MSRLARWLGVWLGAVLLAAILGVGVSSAFAAASPWWSLSVQSVPVNLHPGVAMDAEFELAYTADEGDFLVIGPTGEIRLVPWNATHEQVQAAMREVFPANRVEVGGEPGAYRVKFPGQSADIYGYAVSPVMVTPPIVSRLGQFFGGEELRENGVGVEPTLTRVAAGRPDGQIVVDATNLGDAPANGETGQPITLTAKLPPGVEAEGVIGAAKMWEVTGAIPLGCLLRRQSSEVACTYEGSLAPYASVALVISVVDAGAGAGQFVDASVSGGGALGASATQPVVVGEATPFGVTRYELANENEGGAPDTQAGSHPFQQTTTFFMNQRLNLVNGHVMPMELPKDFHFRWPPGLIGNPSALSQCPMAVFINNEASECPSQSAVGVVHLLIAKPPGLEVSSVVVPLYNLPPSRGEPARLGFRPVVPVYVDSSVRSGEDYGVTVSTENTTEVVGLLAVQATVWGVPGDSSHDRVRGEACLGEDIEQPGRVCEPVHSEHPPAFLSLPTSCSGALRSDLNGDPWVEQRPTAEQPLLASSPMPALDGCDALPFDPQLRVTPDGTQASRPTGLNVDVHIPQEESLNRAGLSVAAPRRITVTLPEGFAINPSGGDGLKACSEALIGFEGFRELTPGFSPATFTPRLPGSFGTEEALEPGRNFCPDTAKIATVRIKTPILPNPLEGAVYLATQNANPFGSLIAMYIVAEDPVSGVLVKLPGEVRLSETGRITATFDNSPQAPFEDAELHFFGGERGPLATPAHCGSYTATGSLTPWSQEPGEAPHPVSSTFSITSGPNGRPCPGPSLPFSPSLSAQTINIQAGAFTPLTTTIGREDGQQDMQSVQLHMPPGVSGLLSNVKLCPEAQANEGGCGPESLIGETTVSAGLGSDPVSVTGGRVYLTGPYHGAPFGLSIVNPVKAGPFDLEHDTSNPVQQPACDCVVVRAKIDVDPHTAALTVTTDPSGPHAIPRLIDGVPVQIKHVYVAIDRPGFTFNPTNCNPMSITGSITGYEDASSPVSVPFQVTNCASLKFAPKFAVSTSAKTSKANGASLTARLSEPGEPFGSQANIAKVKVELPKQLPSRLTTLQKACTNAQFEANPAGCPAASNIGHAKVTTPLLPVPLEGPAIFVSHGGEAFPSLTMVLQGYGVTVDLIGTTFISKTGITSTTFKTVPDVPFNTFELTLPTGKYSALTALGNVCHEKLTMPSEFVAQNGMTLHQNTHVAVTGCAKTKLTRAQKLTAALKACRHKQAKGKRAACERRAHKRYGPVKKKKKK
jgi:hypothetical protein